jgi:TonB family protein
LVDDPDVSGPEDPGVADLRTLASGFLQLARVSGGTTAPPPRDSAPAAVTAARGSTARGSSASGNSAATRITQPVALKQDLPPWPVAAVPLLRSYSGVVEVTITASGNVSDLKFIKSLHPIYDELVRASAKKWKYVPATIAGQPVGSVKTITVEIPKAQ